MTTRLFLLGWVLAAGAPGQAQKPGVNFYSIAREAAIGQAIAQDIRSTLTIVEVPEIQRIAAILAPHTTSAFEYHVVVFDDAIRKPIPRALTIGDNGEPLIIAGGWVFVPSSATHFPALLAHAMAHVALRHASRLDTRENLLQVAVDTIPSGVPKIVPASMEMSLPYATAQFARTFEREADTAAIATLKAAGYDAHDLIDYVKALPQGARRAARIEVLLTSPPTPFRRDPFL
jgi:predicted Zn-dependent protease